MANLAITAAPRINQKWRRHLSAYLFVLPYLIFMLAFGIGPGLYALLISFAGF